MSSFDRENELVLQLIEVGTSLLSPHPSTDELLSLLDETEILLSNVQQDPPTLIQDALLPSMKALISPDFLRHPDDNVRISVVSCLTEITRITAAEAPYDDEHMKEIFQLTVEAFGKLNDMSSRSYRKAELVLDTVSRVRSCLLMLDLECDELIREMFRCFLNTISSKHPQAVVLAIESIMSMVIDESEEVSTDLLDMLLASVRNATGNVSSMSWRLVEKVLSRCACKLKPYIIEALNTEGNCLDMYSPVVSSICQGESSTAKEYNTINSEDNEADEKISERLLVPSDSGKGTLDLVQLSDTNLPKNTPKPPDDGCNQTMSDRNGLTDKNDRSRKGSSRSLMRHLSILGHSGGTDAENKSEAVPKKRGWKPNSLMNPEVGYDHSWISGAEDSLQMPSSKKLLRKRIQKSSLGKPTSMKAPLQKETKSFSSKVGQTAQTVVTSLASLNSSLKGPRKQSRPKSKEMCKDVTSLNVAVKSKPLDEEYLLTPDQEGFGKSKDGRKAVNSGKKVMKTATKESVTEAKAVKASGKRSIVPSDAKKKKLKDSTRHQLIPGSSKSKKMNAQIKVGASSEASKEAPKGNLTRKRSARKEVDLETPHFSEELVGKRIKVWWPLDKTFYEGVVESYDNVRKRHRVSYSDGDMEVLCLKRQRWELIEDDTSGKPNYQQDPEIDLPECSTLSDLLQRQKEDRSKKALATGKTTSSSKGRTSIKPWKKKGVQKELNEQVKRVNDDMKAEAEEPETKEGENLKSQNAEPERPEFDTNEKQDVTQAVGEKKEVEACNKNQELTTREVEDKKSPGQEGSNAGLARMRDLIVPSVTPEEEETEVDSKKNTGISETGQPKERTRNRRRSQMQNLKLWEKAQNENRKLRTREVEDQKSPEQEDSNAVLARVIDVTVPSSTREEKETEVDTKKITGMSETGQPKVRTRNLRSEMQNLKLREKAQNENQELLTRKAEDRKSPEQEDLCAGPGTLRDFTVQNVKHVEKATEVDTEKNTGAFASEMEQPRERTSNLKSQMQNPKMREETKNENLETKTGEAEDKKSQDAIACPRRVRDVTVPNVTHEEKATEVDTETNAGGSETAQPRERTQNLRGQMQNLKPRERNRNENEELKTREAEEQNLQSTEIQIQVLEK